MLREEEMSIRICKQHPTYSQYFGSFSVTDINISSTWLFHVMF
jgi:hypothetical protein